MPAAETRSRGRVVAEPGTWPLAKGMAIRCDDEPDGEWEVWLMVIGRGGRASSGLGVVEELSGVTYTGGED